MDKIINAIVAIAAALTSIAESLKQIAAKSGTVSVSATSPAASENSSGESAEEATKKANQAAALKKAQEAKAAKAAAAKKAAEEAAAAAAAAEAEVSGESAGEGDAGLLGETAPADEEITQATIRELGMKLLKADKEGSAKLQKILSKFKATNLTTLQKEHYKAVHDAVKALIKE